MQMIFQGTLVAKQTYDSRYDFLEGKQGLVIATRTHKHHIGVIAECAISDRSQEELELGRVVKATLDGQPFFKAKVPYTFDGVLYEPRVTFYRAEGLSFDNNLKSIYPPIRNIGMHQN